MVETTKETDGIPLPAITLYFANGAPETQLYRSCYNLNVSIADCLGTNAPNVSKILKKILFGFKKQKRVALDGNEIAGDNNSKFIFTLNFSLEIGPDDDETQFFLFLAQLIFISSLLSILIGP